ncbi:hypothetical protein CRM22_007012 [Opisthorchis felineus]|uniref:Uncharacterized protein n=1 Tax=Opisthorchis felineus TaxID=147828 RepID=A0A4S2LI86_OPIFE|nr:hypothetical protein CRM22_007012 [Opisthorchis felineus]
MLVGGAAPFCPVCHSRGVYSKLMSLECHNGVIKNLCSSAACSYPFSRYESTKISVSKVAAATEEVDNPQCLDDFLNEIFGTSSDHDLTTALSTPITQPPHFSAPDFNHLESRSELSGSTSYKCSSSLFSTNRCGPDSVRGKNCLLPRYLVDNLTLATADRDCNRYGSKPASRLPGGSCDSGISVSSTASPCSPSFTYEEYLKHFNHQSPPTSLSEHPTVVSPTAPRHPASTRKVTRPMSVVDRIIHSRRSLQ